ncbi:hypothetical protein [Escherichia coli]|uniref:hypothetical protein n=1 Tax=Escherichia coli TaxID=562 RepID=UPI002034DA60|nr:hypothetical protein [Escherichia coli]
MSTILPICTLISDKAPKINIAIIQVGLYYKNGGTTEQFYDDMVRFIKSHNVNLVVFSENVYFGYKNLFIKGNTDSFLLKIKSDPSLKKYAFLFNFFGYKQFNNVISMFLYNDRLQLHQKTILIPFIEKKSVFNTSESLSSEYLNILRTAVNDFMDCVHHIWCPLFSQEFQDLPDGAETTLTFMNHPGLKKKLAMQGFAS